MNRTVLVLMVALVAVSGCGFKRPLIRPAAIPKYEADRAERMRKFDERDAEAAQRDAARQAEWEAERAAEKPRPHRPLQNSQPGGTSLQDSLRPPATMEP